MPPKKAAFAKKDGIQTKLNMRSTKAAPVEVAKRKDDQMRIDDRIPAKKLRAEEQIPTKEPQPHLVKEARVSPSDEREIEPGRILRRDEAEEKLKLFDMNTSYGPCMSMSRMDRWARAEKLKLKPPHDILLIMQAFPENSDKSLWHGRVSEDIS